MKTSKLPQELAANASKLHKTVGEILQASPMFKSYEIRQEYPVKKVNPEFSSGREKFDWVILGLKIAIEVHGQQHFIPIRFGGIDMDEAKRRLVAQRDRDEAKKQAALDAGWAHAVVKYMDELSEDSVHQIVRNALEEITIAKTLERMQEVTKQITKVQTRHKLKGKTKWPSKKIPSRPFPKKK
jgi:hypothetical protein